MATADLAALAGRGAAAVERPRRRLLTRVVVPAVIVLGAAGLLFYGARESLRPAVEVTVAPAVLVAGGPSGGAAAAPPGQVALATGGLGAGTIGVAVAWAAERA